MMTRGGEAMQCATVTSPRVGFSAFTLFFLRFTKFAQICLCFTFTVYLLSSMENIVFIYFV